MGRFFIAAFGSARVLSIIGLARLLVPATEKHVCTISMYEPDNYYSEAVNIPRCDLMHMRSAENLRVCGAIFINSALRFDNRMLRALANMSWRLF
jgi:hypothetical protein